MAATRSDRTYWTLWWAIVGASLWLRTGFPIHALANGTFDDQLFIRTARYLGSGQWLGPYDNLTLAKGMAYPFFILIASLLAVPLNIAEQAVYLAASALAARLAYRISADRRLALLLFALLALNPVLWNLQMSRVIREGLYLSLALAAVTLTVAVVFPPAWRSRGLALSCGAALGLVLGAFWLTREEGPWIVPAIAAPVLISLAGTVRGTRSLSGWLGSIGLPLALAAATFAMALGIVAGLNDARYGVFITNEFKSGPFLRAYGALARIGQDHWRPYVVFPKDARERAYAVSPAARELAPVLDGPRARDWARTGCVLAQAAACPEVPSDVFMWELREAVASAGHYTSAPEAMRFYDRLATEINAACAARRIPCGPPRATQMPVFHARYVADALRSAVPIGWSMLTLGNRRIGSAPSEGSPSGIAVFADTVGGVYPVHGAEEILSGWSASPSGAPRLTLRVRTGAQVDTTMSDMPPRDVPEQAPGWTARRFDLRTSCPPADCDLVAETPGGERLELPLSGLKPGFAVERPGLRVFLDYADVHDVNAGSAKRRAIQVAIARVIASGYAYAFPPLAIAALIGVCAALVRRRTRPVPLALFGLAAASAAAVAARLGLLAYLDATSIPAQSVLYGSPASPFTIAFTVIGCWCLARTILPERLFPARSYGSAASIPGTVR